MDHFRFVIFSLTLLLFLLGSIIIRTSSIVFFGDTTSRVGNTHVVHAAATSDWDSLVGEGRPVSPVKMRKGDHYDHSLASSLQRRNQLIFEKLKQDNDEDEDYPVTPTTTTSTTSSFYYYNDGSRRANTRLKKKNQLLAEKSSSKGEQAHQHHGVRLKRPHRLDHDNGGDNITTTFHSSQSNTTNKEILSLSKNSETTGHFSPLSCNPTTWPSSSNSSVSCTKLVSNILPTNHGDTLIIPCAQCYIFDIGGNVTLPGGINVVGKLVFPTNHRVDIYTPYVIVQGELEIIVDSDKISPENMATRFILSGTEDVLFTPSHTPNENACDLQPNGQCNLGRKAFVVAGGKVNIHAMPESSCRTFTPVKKKIYKDPSYNTTNLCDELVFNGDAEGNGFEIYPMGTTIRHEELIIVEEDGNKFWRMYNRLSHRSSIVYQFPNISCFERGVEYFLSSRVRLHYSDGFVGGAETYNWYISNKPHRGKMHKESLERIVLHCPAQTIDDGWVLCSGAFMVDDFLSEQGRELFLAMGLENIRDGARYNLDFDDISIRYHRGYVNELVVDSNDVSCWGNGSNVHVTSAVFYNTFHEKSNGFQSQIEKVVDKGDGTAVVQLTEAAILPIMSQEENNDYAVELALLSRNVVIEGDGGENEKGGYMQVLRTPNITQTIKGVEFVNMGRKSEDDKFALQLLHCGNVKGTLISRNTFRQSNHRCIVLEGTSNVTISRNIGYQTYGHCMYIGLESQSNLVTGNLVSDTKTIKQEHVLASETDDFAAGFLNWYGPNNFTYNVAVAGQSDGFNFDCRDAITNKIGTFDHNTAKSNFDNGFKFSNYLSDEELVLSNIKTFKNRYVGFGVHSSYSVELRSSLVAENTLHNIDMKLLDHFQIKDTIVKGYTLETKSLVKPPYFNKPCISYSFSSLIGLKMPTEPYREDSDKKGATLTNVRFTDFDHSDNCTKSIPISFYSNSIDHFNYLAMFSNVTADGTRMIDAVSSNEHGLKDIIIHDINGSSDPSGQTSQKPGVFVSNTKSMKAFAGGVCKKYPDGTSYCSESCLRTMAFMVDQSSSADFSVRVTRQSDGKETILPYMYKYDDDLHLKSFSEYHRLYSVSLPFGSYKIEFLKDLWKQVWPGFVLPRWQDPPECDGYVSVENVTFVEPNVPCQDLAVNGDVEAGIYHWLQNNGGSPANGKMLVIEGDGVHNSSALRYTNRSWNAFGVGQNLDTSCIHQSVIGEYFEIQLFFRLEEGTKPFICNPYSSSFPDRCPEVVFLEYLFEGEKLLSKTTTQRATTVVPNNIERFNVMHGIFRVDKSIQSLVRLYLNVAYVDKKFDLIVDDLTVRKLRLACKGELVRNKDFEDGGKYWSRAGSAHLDIEVLPSGGKSLKISKKENKWHGVSQLLYLDKDCLQENERFQISGFFQIQSAANGTKYECNWKLENTELECSYLIIETQSTLGIETIHLDTVPIARSLKKGWSMLSGSIAISKKMLAYDKISLYLYGTHKTMNVFYHNISITPIPKTCQNQVLNGDFEKGDARFWRYSSRFFIDVDIFDSGAHESQYSIMLQGGSRSGSSGTGLHRISQSLDMRCLEKGEEFLVKAKFRLLNATDLSSGVQCDPALLAVSRVTHCPTVNIRGTDCAEDDFEFLLWNDIDHFEWNASSFNDFQKVFSVTSQVASCKNVAIELGQFVHEGRVLLVDDVQLIKLSTTVYPTYSPTKKTKDEPTREPTFRTNEPTTSILFVCPPVGSAPLVVSAGSIMLQVTSTSLCTLTKSTASIEKGKTTLIPIARSYDNNPWEKSAGDFAASIFGEKEILCYPVGCQLQLPSLEEGAEYLLSSFSYSLSKVDKYARFLETATFGTTQKQLDAFEEYDNVQNPIVSWLADQMDSNVTQMTSHREYWRRGLNGRMPTSRVMGVPSHPCAANSRWRTISFVQHDAEGLLERNLRVLGTGPFILEFNGQIRTVVDNIHINHGGYSHYKFDPSFNYKICAFPDLAIGGRLFIQLEDGQCRKIQNPPVNLEGYESFVNNIFDFADDALEPIDEWWDDGEGQVFVQRSSLFDDPSFSGICAELPPLPAYTDEPVFARTSNGKWLLFDPRLSLDTNTPRSPIADGGKSSFVDSGGKKYCSNAPRTFLNEFECKLSPKNACTQSSNNQVSILLNNSTISALNNLTGRYVYGVKGLLVKYDGILLDHPCNPGLRSRWEPVNILECNPTPLYDDTSSTLSDLLSKSTDTNPHIRDIYFPEEGSYCNVRDTEPEIEIEVNGQCWKRVHDEHMSIFDMTYWVDIHPGGSYSIQKWAENNGTFLVYPSLLERIPHGMANWNNNWQKFTYVGRFGDSMELGDLPNLLRQVEVTNFFDKSSPSDDSQVLVCGSFGEVGNDKSKGLIFDAHTGFYTVLQTRGYNKAYNRFYAWLMISLQASDQLRQRVAWVFSQILVIVRSAIRNENGRTEGFLYYYDIFVRNAFGNYRDILREVSYNTYMAETLSFIGSKSSAYMLERYRIKASADENFAREIMQLFTIGVYQLNMDGSFRLDTNGNKIRTYSIKDIMSLSRAWTGFDRQPQRGNVEDWDSPTDPMKIVPEWRDRFPKSDTTGGYIGDKYPLCSDFPPRLFLRKGARYRLLGSSNLPELISDPAEFATEDTATRLILSETSSLRSILCNKDQSGACVFENFVVLPSHYKCTDIECEIDTVRVVQVTPKIFYEFVPPPCVTLAFYNNAVRIGPRRNADSVMCADPRLSVASEACCATSGIDRTYASRNLKYSGERMSLATAESRCAAASREICVYYRVDGNFFENRGYFWTPESCSLQVKVKRDGTVAIVHQPKKIVGRVMHVDSENNNYFRVHWERVDDYPRVDNDCDGVCEVLTEGACLCNTRTVEIAVFDDMPSNKEELIEKLSIGGVDPEVFDSDYYSSIVNSNAGITAYLKSGGFNAETIFKYRDDKGRTFFVKNSKSLVYLRGVASWDTGQSFRNTPQFMSFIPSETNLRDAQYETEAVLDHLFFHDNTPPFLATRLIQRLVTSNPGPRYIRTVAEAFKTGSYSAGGISFGSGKYGDLAATFAAIYLDSAARSVVLDADITSGTLREPIVKVVGLMRSMEYVSHAPITMVHGMYNKIGQDAHNFESVFSFFRPDFKPHGRIGDAGLVSPEAFILDMPKITGLLNGLMSMVKFGLSSCEAGFSIQEYCLESIYRPSELGVLEFNKTSSSHHGFSIMESFEGPSLVGGLDNLWVGRSFGSHNGTIVIDPLDTEGHVLTFSSSSTDERIFSPPIKNKDLGGNPYVVKFRYLGVGSSPGGCIGYADGESTNSQTWTFCDKETMESKGQWVSCQFSVPKQIESFRIVLGDTKLGGNAYFDDIQVVSGNDFGTTCIGVEVTKVSPQGQVGYSKTVVDRLSTLLTAGRLGRKAKSIIVEAFDNAGSADDGLRVAQQLILTTAEFHSTNPVKSTNKPRDNVVYPRSTGKPYKAVIYLYLEGGCDSYNLLVPYTCSKNLYNNYLDVRQNVALAKNQLLPISASDQVCSQFGIHENLPAIKTLYDNEDLLFFANTGVLSKPVNKDNYYAETNVQLFSHSHMHKEAMTIDPYELNIGTGVLGRINDILHQKGHNVGSFSVEGLTVALVGKPGISDSPVVIGSKGVQKVYLDGIENQLSSLHNQSHPDSGIFSEKWSSLLMESIGTNDLLGSNLDDITTSTEFPDNFLGNSLETISKVIATREVRGVDVDTFYISKTGFDTHTDVEKLLRGLFSELNDAIFAFSEEMKMMNIWDNVTVIQTSDFGRTLNPNGNDGTDHAWGGNYMMMGGSVKGGNVLGQYPDDLTDDGPLTLERGRMIPTTPWESAFRGIALWLDIEDKRIDEVCPNIQNFNSSHIIEVGAMFDGISIPSISPSTIQSFPPSDIPEIEPSISEGRMPTEISPVMPSMSSPPPSRAHSSGANRQSSRRHLFVVCWILVLFFASLVL